MPRSARISLTLPAILTAVVTLASATAASAQAPSPGALEALDAGVRIRANGPAVRDAVPPSLGEVLERGLASLVIRPPAEGVVVSATPQSLSFMERRRDRLVEVPWSGVDHLELYGGRSAGLGFVQGAGAGALAGLLLWGGIELMFFFADNPVVDDPGLIVGLTAGGGGLLGAVTLGHRWNRIHPAGR